MRMLTPIWQRTAVFLAFDFASSYLLTLLVDGVLYFAFTSTIALALATAQCTCTQTTVTAVALAQLFGCFPFFQVVVGNKDLI